MLTNICQEIRNWFDRGQPKFNGIFTIENNKITEIDEKIKENQYIRIIGSTFNDGVHKYGEQLTDEEFTGSVWLMAIPNSFLKLVDEVNEYVLNNESSGKSPYTSESFGGYSYTRATKSDGSFVTWTDAFKTRLNAWRKI